MKIWSNQKTGQWASILTLLFIGLMALKLGNFHLPLPSQLLFLLGFIGFVLALISIFKFKDRALFVFLTIPIGLIIVFWTVAELLYPH